MKEVEERLPEWPALLMVRLLCLGNLGVTFRRLGETSFDQKPGSNPHETNSFP